MVKVSVLMPVYNVDKGYLEESIKSILNQTFSDFELIIVDDGSIENIEPIIASFKDERIKLYKNEKNLGVSKTRNKLIELSKGEYIAWQDADDISDKIGLEKQVNFLDEHKDISAVGTYLECFPNKKIMKVPKSPKIIDFLGGCMMFQPSAMLRIEDFKKHNLYYNSELKTSEDYDLWSRAIKFLKFENIEEPLLRYRISQNSLYHKANKYSYKLDKDIKYNLIKDLTDDTNLQQQIMKTVSKHYQKKSGFLENIFAIRNEWQGDKKVKLLVIFGIKIKLHELREIK